MLRKGPGSPADPRLAAWPAGLLSRWLTGRLASPGPPGRLGTTQEADRPARCHAAKRSELSELCGMSSGAVQRAGAEGA